MQRNNLWKLFLFEAGSKKKQVNKHKENCNFTVNRDHSYKTRMVNYCTPADILQYLQYLRIINQSKMN